MKLNKAGVQQRLAVVGVLVVGALAGGNAFAETLRYQYVASSALCEAVDPSNFEGLRFRSVGIYNASNSSIQVACSLPADLNGDVDTATVSVQVHNFRTGAASMNCAASGGSRALGTNVYPFSINVSAGGDALGEVSNVDKVSAGSYGFYSVVCIIPPKMELSTLRWIETSAEDDL